MDLLPIVQELWTYPVKSCRGIALKEAVTTVRGLRWDRSFAIFDQEGEVQDIRIHPKLCTLQPSFEHDPTGAETHLLLDSDPAILKMPTLRVPLEQATGLPSLEVRDRVKDLWWGGPLQGTCCGPEAARWLTEVLEHHASKALKGNTYRLVRYNADADTRRLHRSFRGKNPQKAGPDDTACFADCAPYHLLSLESMQDLNDRLAAAGEELVTLHRFRPNIVVSGAGSAHGEDLWARFAFEAGRQPADTSTAEPPSQGELVFRLHGLTGRCVIPTTHPFKGERNEAEQPREMLKSYRPMPYGAGPHGGPVFGVWLVCETPGGMLQVGQRVRVDQSKL